MKPNVISVLKSPVIYRIKLKYKTIEYSSIWNVPTWRRMNLEVAVYGNSSNYIYWEPMKTRQRDDGSNNVGQQPIRALDEKAFTIIWVLPFEFELPTW